MARKPVSEAAAKSVEFGIRFEDDQIVTYGLDALNRQLRKGLVVTRIVEGDPMVAEMEAEDGSVEYALAGVGFRAELAPATTDSANPAQKPGQE